MRWCRGSRHRERTHAARPGRAQHGRAGVDGRTGRQDVVDEKNRASADQRACAHARDERDGARHAQRTFGPRQPHLGRRRARAAQHVRHGYSKVRGEFAGLVEPSAPPPPPVERHRHDQVRLCEQVGAGPPHESGERPRQRAVPVVLEGMQDGPQAALVGSDRPRCRSRLAVPGTGPDGDGRGNGVPATPADEAAGRFRQGRCARGAGGRPDHRQHRVGQRPDGGPQINRAPLPRRDTRCARRFPRGAPGRRSAASRR